MEFQSSTGGTPGQGVGCIRHETGLPAPEPVPVPVAVVATEALGEWRDPAAAAAAIATAVAAAVAVAAPVTASPQRAWRMPVVAEEEATCRGPRRNRRNDWHRSHGPRARHVADAPLLVPRGTRITCPTLSTRTSRIGEDLTPGTRGTGAGHPPVALRAKAGRIFFSGARLPHARNGESAGGAPREKRATATKQAVETPGGGRDHPSRTSASRHRRAASRSGGATSAERDGRPVKRSIRSSGSGRILRSEQRSTLRVGDISTRRLGRYDMGGVVVSGQRRCPIPTRYPVTAPGHGVGHGPSGP
jgi:hypothetical protein